MFRWLIGGLIACCTGLLLVAVPLNQMLYGWEWKATTTGAAALVVFVGAAGFLAGREWGRRVLIVAACTAILLLVVNTGRSAAQTRGVRVVSSAVGVVLCLLTLAGLSLPSVKGAMGHRSGAVGQ